MHVTIVESVRRKSHNNDMRDVKKNEQSFGVFVSHVSPNAEKIFAFAIFKKTLILVDESVRIEKAS